MYYLKLTGTISRQNRAEFEQTFRIFCSEIPASCSGYFVAKDVLLENVYHFISYWPDLDSFETFVKSASYNMLTGSFRTLGELSEKTSSKLVSF